MSYNVFCKCQTMICGELVKAVVEGSCNCELMVTGQGSIGQVNTDQKTKMGNLVHIKQSWFGNICNDNNQLPLVLKKDLSW